MKADKNANTISLDNEDVQMMTKETTEAAQTRFKTIEEQQEEIVGTVTSLLNVLCKVVEDVKIVVNCLVPTMESQEPPDN